MAVGVINDGASHQPSPARPTGRRFCRGGVFKGDFSRKIIDVVAPKQLHLILAPMQKYWK
jgi:hypothetical protein